MKLNNQACFLLGKSMALIEDLFISIKGDPLIKNDLSHKIMLLRQDVDLFLIKAFNEENK